MYYLVTNPDGSKDGPFTDDPTPTLTTGQVVSMLSDADYPAYDAARRAAIAKQQAIDECRAARAARYDAEASVFDLADAETKMASPDPAEQAAGVAQKAAVLAKRLQIKAAIPKPQ